jgi:hypothetical protein
MFRSNSPKIDFHEKRQEEEQSKQRGGGRRRGWGEEEEETRRREDGKSKKIKMGVYRINVRSFLNPPISECKLSTC